MSGWTAMTDIWASGSGAPVYSMTQNVASPSFDAKSTKFYLGGTSYSNVLFHKSLGSNSTAQSFVMDYYVWVDNASAPQALEVAVLQSHGYKWYKLSTQCDFAGKGWRLWAGGTTGGWKSSGVACPRLMSQAWNHVTMELEIVNGKTHFIAETTNGVKHYINIYGAPVPQSYSSNALGMHYQMDGNQYQTPYTMWVDRMNITISSKSGAFN